MLNFKTIIDISQPVSETSACFPGDTPFSRKVTLTYDESKVINLTALTMSPHVGTHADAPVHIKGALMITGAGAAAGATDSKAAFAKGTDDTTIGDMGLEAFIGEVEVIDVSPTTGGITADLVRDRLIAASQSVKRILFKTATTINYEVFEEAYSYIAADTAELMGELGIVLTGIDTPSVDHIRSKDLATHHALDKHKLVWLENLDLTRVGAGRYFLIALPIKFMDLEASPVRAVLLV